MKILVVAATETEISPFIRFNQTADVLITGIGIAHTIYHLLKKLLVSSYDLVVQAGVAGTFTTSISHGEVVLVNKDTFGDLGIFENEKFRTIFEAGLLTSEPPFENGWLPNHNHVLEDSALKKVAGITIQTISDSQAQKNQLVQKFEPDIESMEGAAFHYVCLQQQVPFIQMRSISNDVGIRDKSKWHLHEAITTLNIEVKNLLEQYI